MKKLLLLCVILAGTFIFTGYCDDSTQATDQVAITGFGGYTLGGKLNPEAINQKMRETGYVFVKAKTQFRNFEKVQLFFTPKTLLVYQINSRAKGNLDDLLIIKASFEKKYKEKMENVFGGFGITRGDRVIKIGTDRSGKDENFISIADLILAKQAQKEKTELSQEQIDTTGL
jgi:hypothetical protein